MVLRINNITCYVQAAIVNSQTLEEVARLEKVTFLLILSRFVKELQLLIFMLFSRISNILYLKSMLVSTTDCLVYYH